MTVRLIGVVLLAGVLAWASPSAKAQMETREGIALQNQILELRRDMQTLQSQGGRGGPTAPGSSYLGGSYGGRPAYTLPSSGGDSDITAQLLQRVQSLEEQMRQLRGQVEELSNQTQRQNADMAKQLGDLNFALQQGGAAQGRTATGGAASGGASASTTPPPRPRASSSESSPSPSSGSARRTPEVALQEGHAALARRDYAAAESAAREVLAKRTSPRAYDGQLLLAQALAGQRNYSQAAIAYDDTYNRARTGSHAPEALVGLANSLSAIGEKRAACETLARLNAEFSRPSASIREAAAGVRQRAACR